MTHPGVSGEHDEFCGIFLQLRRRESRDLLTEQDYRFTVGDAGAASHNYRGIKLLGQFEGKPGEVLALLGVGGLQHGNLGELGVVAAVLLVLG